MNPAELKAEDEVLRRLAAIQGGESNWSPDESEESSSAERMRAALVEISFIARMALAKAGGR